MTNSEKDRSINFAAVRAAVESGLHKLELDPVRGMRSMVDLGKYFSRTHHQKNFFQTAQKMLGRKGGPYMRLVKHTIASVDHDVLKNVGINLGYFGWSQGAKTIREVEATQGFNVPWSFTLLLDSSAPNCLSVQEVCQCIEQTRDLGAHCFWIEISGDTAYIDRIMHKLSDFRDCVFALMLTPDAISADIAALALESTNMVIAIKCDGISDISPAMAVLRDARLIYGLYYMYDDSNASNITSGSICDIVVNGGGIFALFVRKAECSAECGNTVHAYASGEKNAPEKPAYMIDFFDDIAIIDRNISTQECYIEISADGDIAAKPWSARTGINLRTHHLTQALSELAPRLPEADIST